MKKSVRKTSKKQKSGPKSSSRRSKVKYAALNPNYNLKRRADEISDIYSYAKDIPDDAIDPKTGKLIKEWLNSFTEEYVNANFKHNGPKIMKKVAQKRERYRANNYRNKDIYTGEKAQNKLNYIEDIKEKLGVDQADDFDLELSPDENDENKGFYYWDNED